MLLPAALVFYVFGWGRLMFTGLVEAVGTVVAVRHRRGAREFTLESEHIAAELGIGDSVAINGVCLTVTATDATATFTVEVVPETLKKTTLGMLAPGDAVNLERALRATDRIGGHFVQGHVDAVGAIVSISHRGAEREYWIRFPAEWRAMIVPQGSIAVDGVSLTVAAIEGANFKVAIIPHTFEHTIFRLYQQERKVNLEFDIIGKYVARWMKHYRP